MDIFKGKSSIIFDFDGTIADTFSLHEAAFQDALKSYNVNFDYSYYLGMSTNDVIKHILESNGIKVGEEDQRSLINLKRSLANKAYQRNLQFISGASEFIELVHQNGLSLYIASSGSRMNVRAGIKTLDIHHFFDDVITSEDVSYSKPNPEVFQIILDKYNIFPGSALVIEDAASGIEAALSAGIDVICVNSSLSSAPAYFNKIQFASFSELIDRFELHIQNEQSGSCHRNL